MKYDCNKTLDYAHELKRLCAAHHACADCPMRGETNCITATCITRPHINVVQKWSDSNPEPVNKDKFLSDFKDYWGTDFDTKEDFELYVKLLSWLENELEKI